MFPLRCKAMASPQKENGYVPIANELVEHLASIRISGEAMQVLWVILRKTYGFNKKEDAIALSQFCLATSLKKQTIIRALAKLKQMGVVTQKGYGAANIYMFTKDYDKWKPLPKKVTYPKKVTRVTNKGNNRNPKRDIQKTITKDTTTKDTTEPQAALIGELIKSFEGMNPSTKVLYGSPPQRKASVRLLEVHGLERIRKAIAYVEMNRDDRFCPSITTPVQLEAKWAQLEDFGRKKQSRIKKVIM